MTINVSHLHGNGWLKHINMWQLSGRVLVSSGMVLSTVGDGDLNRSDVGGLDRWYRSLRFARISSLIFQSFPAAGPALCVGGPTTGSCFALEKGQAARPQFLIRAQQHNGAGEKRQVHQELLRCLLTNAVLLHKGKNPTLKHYKRKHEAFYLCFLWCPTFCSAHFLLAFHNGGLQSTKSWYCSQLFIYLFIHVLSSLCHFWFS